MLVIATALKKTMVQQKVQTIVKVPKKSTVYQMACSILQDLIQMMETRLAN